MAERSEGRAPGLSAVQRPIAKAEQHDDNSRVRSAFLSSAGPKSILVAAPTSCALPGVLLGHLLTCFRDEETTTVKQQAVGEWRPCTAARYASVGGVHHMWVAL